MHMLSLDRVIINNPRLLSINLGQLPVLLRANQLLHLRPQAGQADGLLLHALPSPHLLRLPGQLFSVPQPAGVQK